jgi:hypothetical protein
MSNAGILYLLVFAVIITAFGTHHVDSKLCAGNDAQGAVMAYEHKDIVTGEQNTINQKEVSVYEKDHSAIGTLYASGMSTAPTRADMPKLSRTTAGTKPAQCQVRSLKYHLTFEQCDDAKLGYITLWDDWEAQAKVK